MVRAVPGVSPLRPHWLLPFLSGPSQEATKSRVRTGSEEAIHTMFGPENQPLSLSLEDSSNLLHCHALGRIPECGGPLFVLLPTLLLKLESDATWNNSHPRQDGEMDKQGLS